MSVRQSEEYLFDPEEVHYPSPVPQSYPPSLLQVPANNPSPVLVDQGH
jgi:hypothetical protein